MEKDPVKCQSATPLWGGASALALVTGLSNKGGGSCPPMHLPGRVALRGVGSCRVLRSLAANLNTWQPDTSLAPC